MINVNMKNRYSNNYIGSAYTNDPDYEKYLAEAKAIFKQLQSGSKKKLRLEKRGREPFVKQVVRNPWFGYTRTLSYDWGGNVVGGLKNAKRIDFYVYNR